MQLGPAGSPRPDAYSLPCSFTRFTPIAYECKISVADFRRDVTAGKWTSYMQYAAGVIFAVPAGLVGKDDLPSGCGLMARSEAGWRVIKGPALSPVLNLPRDAWLKLLMDGLARLRAEPRNRTSNGWHVESIARKKWGDVLADAVRDHIYADSRLQRATEKLNKAAAEAEAAYQREIDMAEERATREASRIDNVRSQLAEALGLPADARIADIARAGREACDRLEQDEEIKRLRRQLSAVQDALTAALKPLPQIVGVDE